MSPRALKSSRWLGTRTNSRGAASRWPADVIGPSDGYGLGWFISEDGGAFGAVPWIDLGRGYGAYLVVEDASRVGRDLAGQVRPLIDQQIDVLVPS